MTWTDEDTRTLRAQGRCLDCAVDPSVAHDHSAELEQRAADEIERLQARVAELEAEREVASRVFLRRGAGDAEGGGVMDDYDVDQDAEEFAEGVSAEDQEAFDALVSTVARRRAFKTCSDAAYACGIVEGRRLEREQIVAMLDKGIEKHKTRDTQVADYLRNLRHRVLSDEHEEG